MRTSFSLALALALAGPGLAQSDDPDARVEPNCRNHRWSWNDGMPNLAFDASASPLPENGYQWRPSVVDMKPGDINCRRWDQTPSNVGYWSCNDLATANDITLDKFWELNPGLAPDCECIKPGTLYCVRGFIEPLRAYDGNCGPQYKNATCIGVDFGQCCNSETWRCGETEHDCSIGVCYEGLCPGYKVYTTDGNCGENHSYSLCGGKWGDCCSLKNRCGTGPEFCGVGKCQSGNCTVLKGYDGKDQM